MIFLHLHFQKHTIISMKKHLLIILFSATNFQLSAQEYNLNNFKYRYQQYKSLEFNYNTSGYGEHYSATNTTPKINLFLNYSFDGYLHYKKFYNTDAKYKNEAYYIRIASSKVYSDYSNIDIFVNNNAPFKRIVENKKNNDLGLGYKNSTILYHGNQFYTWEYSGNTSISGGNSSIKDSISKGGTRLYSNLAAGIGLGKGRLEVVTDAVTAWYMLEDFKKNGIISDYTPEQLENLAKGIVEARNKRFLPDSRYQYIDQITLLDSVCKANHIMTNNSIKYYAALNDNFIWGQSSQRQSGHQLKQMISLNGRYDNNFDIRYQQVKPYKEMSFNYIFTFEKYKQLNLKTQKHSSVSVALSHQTNFDSRPTERIDLQLSHEYLYQPNSRTFYNFNISGRYAYNFNKYAIQKIQYYGYQLNPQLDFKHFFSRNLAIEASASLTIRQYISKNEYVNTDSIIRENSFLLNSNFKSSISYYLF